MKMDGRVFSFCFPPFLWLHPGFSPLPLIVHFLLGFIFKMLDVCFILASMRQNFYKITHSLLPVWASLMTKDFTVTLAFFSLAASMSSTGANSCLFKC